MKMQKFKTLIAAAFGLTTLAGTVQAQSGADTVYQITPYAWATGIGGDITPFTGAPAVSISKSFSDLIKDLDAAFFISAYARHGNLVFMGDVSSSSSSRSGTVPVLGLPATGKLRQTSVTALAGYRVAQTPNATFDILGGVRHWRVRGAVETPLGDASRRVNFTDPIIAARANFQIAPGWSGLLYADVGGFGVGSKLTAQLLGTVNYQLRENAFLSVGYRHLHVDYRSGGTTFDMRMSGPIIGASLRF
ncbi:hypothetical protein LY56_03461 [Roseinatronobacter thiooxidans]|uniref:Outer membrane protein beta-barrel domain-containing protein n=1 Tax=Roseinatronobacter thiooxidans TaxID=121821 RepID=A0A2W7RED1_9RHOB|nr:hypothetical protein [Roseinatronobacter thiooxidans]PZX36312.1 hypothetical protein LY56_03461 [Roseinatronobacter thiooxidans]